MKKIYPLALSAVILSGCVTLSPNAFKVSQEQLAQRNIETRKYEGLAEEVILAASANVLQDLGYNLDNSETKLGLISASKERDATNAAQVVGAVLIALLGGGSTAIDSDQKIRVSLVVRPSHYEDSSKKSDKSFMVRITFQRFVKRTDGSMYAETLKEDSLYVGFFEKLSKSVFIEGQKI
jgi:hypothetical protein